MKLPKGKRDYDAINAKVAERFTCHHMDTIRCKKVKANHQAEYRHQCKGCGMQVGNAISYNEISQGDRDRLPEWDGDLHKQFDARKSAYWNELAGKEDQRIYKDWIGQYRVYLKTAEWKHLRERVVGRAGTVCEGCGQHPPTEVHHLTYAHAGEEFLFELAALCKRCHDRLHPQGDEPPEDASPPPWRQ